MAASASQKYLVITCDSEALPREAPCDHVDRLIWGRFPDAPRDAGIGMLMDIVDEFGGKMTFFHDAIEKLAYGDEIDRAARYIIDRGHDLQLHLHVEFLPADFWHKLGYRPVTWAMNLYNGNAARHVLEFGIELFEGMAGFRPRAFRAGAFRYNMSTLQALKELGVEMSFQYNPATVKKAKFPHGFDAGILPVFRWSNGLIEVPHGLYEFPYPRHSEFRYKSFELRELRNAEQASVMMKDMWKRGPDYNVMVLLLHSWSLLERNDAGHYVWQGNRLAELFRQVLANLPSDVKIVSASELGELIASGKVTPALEMPLPVGGTDAIPLIPLWNIEELKRQAAYRNLVSRVKRMVVESTPPGSVVAVVSKGDESLLQIEGREARHFPHKDDEPLAYLGYYPADSAEAIARLEDARVRGANFIFFPQTAFWWLEHYDGLRSHLEQRCRKVLANDTCVIYTLDVPVNVSSPFPSKGGGA